MVIWQTCPQARFAAVRGQVCKPAVRGARSTENASLAARRSCRNDGSGTSNGRFADLTPKRGPLAHIYGDGRVVSLGEPPHDEVAEPVATEAAPLELRQGARAPGNSASVVSIVLTSSPPQ